MFHAEEVVHDLSMWPPFSLRSFLLIRVKIVDTSDAIQIVERQAWLIAQVAANIKQSVGRDFDPWIDILEVCAGDLLAKLRFQLIDECGTSHRKVEVNGLELNVQRPAS